MKIKKRNKAVLIVLGLFLASTFVFVIAINIPIPTTFNVAVTTERIEYRTIDNNNSRIPLNNITIYNYLGDCLGLYNGSFEINKGAIVLLERVSMGPLLIQIKGHDDESAGTFYSDNQDEIEKKAENFVEFFVDDPSKRNNNGETILIPISGEVILGRTVNYESYSSSTALVKSGSITMVGKSLFGNQFFESGTYNLNIGDRFEIDMPQSKAYGFAVVNEESAMKVAYRVVGKKGKILTPGPVDEGSGYFISTSLLSRFLYDSFFQGISWSFASLILIATVFPLLNDLEETLFSKRKRKNKLKDV